MEKVNFGFWRSSSTLSKSQLTELPLQPQLVTHVQELTQQHKVVTPYADNYQVDPSKQATKTLSDLQFEQLLSHLLKYGVLIASTIVLVGGILYLIRHGAEPANYQFFRGEPSQFCSPIGVVTSVFSGSPRGIIQLGLLLLIATPILRVVISLLTFIRRKEMSYVIITLIVLTSLIYSLVGTYKGAG